MPTKLLCLAMQVFLLFSLSRPSFAYGPDVHFNLTYVMCRLAGLEAKDALWVAAADQSMDDNDCTTAYRIGKFHTYFQINWKTNGRLWHAFSDEGADPETLDTSTLLGPVTISYAPPKGDGGVKARNAVRERLLRLWQRIPAHPEVKDDDARIRADIALGQFLHFEQDFYAHRQLTGEDRYDDKYLPYGTQWGHAKVVHTPDQVPVRPYLAKKMVEDGYDWIRKYVTALNNSATLSTPLPHTTLDLLIDALVKSYPPALTPDSEFPTQKQATDSLKAGLSNSLFRSAWSNAVDLPVYTSSLTLPYDKPETSIKSIEEKMDGALKISTQ